MAWSAAKGRYRLTGDIKQHSREGGSPTARTQPATASLAVALAPLAFAAERAALPATWVLSLAASRAAGRVASSLAARLASFSSAASAFGSSVDSSALATAFALVYFTFDWPSRQRLWPSPVQQLPKFARRAQVRPLRPRVGASVDVTAAGPASLAGAARRSLVTFGQVTRQGALCSERRRSCLPSRGRRAAQGPRRRSAR